MDNHFNKKKVIRILLISSISLLLINIVAGKYFTSKTKNELNKVSLETADKVFLQSLFALGISQEQIKTRKLLKKTEVKSYVLKVPGDLPIPNILVELKNNFDSLNVKIAIKEKNIGGKTLINIFSGEDELISAELNYDSEIIRKGGHVAFVLQGVSNLDNDKLSELLSAPELFGVLIVPSKSNFAFKDSLLKYRKESLILLNDENNELKYKLDAGYSKLRLRASLKSIVDDFQKSVCVVIDENSDMSEPELYNLLFEVFKVRSIRQLKYGDFFIPSGTSIEEKLNSFNAAMEKIRNNGKVLILLDAMEYSAFLPEIVRYRKIGYKFINPSEIIRSLDK
ncbi:MAG: hypothetical protein IPM56_04800 [Ignavibacteriales bacterium]|nr:MAG: hypothetical protein IPM56_04800 [Ignavibacteriales bacterium]